MARSEIKRERKKEKRRKKAEIPPRKRYDLLKNRDNGQTSTLFDL